MNIPVYPDETLEDLQLDGLMLIQKKNGFRFGLDAVILSDFARLPPNAVAADLCSGGGIVALLLCHHYEPRRVDAVELQASYAEIANRNAEMNGLSDKLLVYNRDLKDAPEFLRPGAYDAVVCNPPYKKLNTGFSSPADEIAIAREERTVSLSDIAEISSKLLRFGGKLFLVHRPERLAEVFSALVSNKLEPKRLRFAENKAGMKPSLFLLEAVLGAKPGLSVEAQLTVYNADGSESEETKRIYRRK